MMSKAPLRGRGYVSGLRERGRGTGGRRRWGCVKEKNIPQTVHKINSIVASLSFTKSKLIAIAL